MITQSPLRYGIFTARRSHTSAPVPTMIERDDNIPELDELVAELEHRPRARRRSQARQAA